MPDMRELRKPGLSCASRAEDRLAKLRSLEERESQAATEHRIMAEEAVIVVGGGIVGISCALSAQERGLTVLLCDPGEARRRASYGNAGCISRSSLFPMSGPGLWKNLPTTSSIATRACACTTRSFPALRLGSRAS